MVPPLPKNPSQALVRRGLGRFSLKLVTGSLAFVLVIAASWARATTIIGPWIPIFKGVDHSVSTNLPSGGDFPNLHVVHAFRIDLKDPDIRLLTTPRITNYLASVREVGGQTISNFLKLNHLQAAINANFFETTTYYLPAGTPMDVYGLQISQGVVVSAQESRSYAAALVFDAANQATVIYTNWPARNVEGMFTAVSGNYPLVVAGKNIISRNARETDPRTAFGLSQDRRYLYLVGIDGRQPGYSNGANDYETAGWLLLLGAYDGVNMDGGGSTTLVIENSTGVPVRLNKSSAVADSGRERTVGSHLGVYAKPLPAFINDVVAWPDDTTARITWTTIEPATSEVYYDMTTDFGYSSGLQPDLVTNHVVQLTGLTPATSYFYRVVSSIGTQRHVSPDYSLVTTNYVTTNQVFELTNPWKYTTASLNGIEWTSRSYDDSAWSGPGPGLLWVDVRASAPNPLVEPRNTEMPADANNYGYPYVTYYFRTQFELTKLLPGSALAFSGFIDDGAVFYVNGAEVYRLRMPANASNQTLASSYPCSGDATCLDEFIIPDASLAKLVAGTNVLAVEVHNYNLRSADITFGLALSRIEPRDREARLSIHQDHGAILLSWEAYGYVLQSASAPQGPWTEVDGVTGNSLELGPLQSNQYYRLRK